MFRNDLGDVGLFGGRAAAGRKPSFRPAVEALEQRLVLDAGVTLAPSDHGSSPGAFDHSNLNDGMYRVAQEAVLLAGQLFKPGHPRLKTVMKDFDTLAGKPFLSLVAAEDAATNFQGTQAWDPSFRAAFKLYDTMENLMILHGALRPPAGVKVPKQVPRELALIVYNQAISDFRDATGLPLLSGHDGP
jgi:hypothetical protein